MLTSVRLLPPVRSSSRDWRASSNSCLAIVPTPPIATRPCTHSVWGMLMPTDDMLCDRVEALLCWIENEGRYPRPENVGRYYSPVLDRASAFRRSVRVDRTFDRGVVPYGLRTTRDRWDVCSVVGKPPIPLRADAVRLTSARRV